ncbi:ubiE/COQ5 methyltransferase [Gracilaria domingensis]|nr:ubiE/COQ5 methyltransferase [Gracilaria domingensis]
MPLFRTILAVTTAALICRVYSEERGEESCVVPGSGKFFDKIAARYDFLNQVISLGLHGSWKNSAIKKILPAESVLDISTGTGDLALSLAANRSIRVVGLDPSAEMLKIAQEKLNGVANSIGNVDLVEGVAEELPFESESFDAVTVAFGVRNFQDTRKGLQEMARILKQGGRWAILEAGFSSGDSFLEKFHRVFVTGIMPKVAGIVSGNRGAYEYLSASMQEFPEVEDFVKMVEEAGLKVEAHERLAPFGMALLDLSINIAQDETVVHKKAIPS